MNPQPGEVWLAISDWPQRLGRQRAYEVTVPRQTFLHSESVANVQGLSSMPRVRPEHRLGKLSPDTMARIRRALVFALDLEVERPDRV
jgi:mRNA interferase MazF